MDPTADSFRQERWLDPGPSPSPLTWAGEEAPLFGSQILDVAIGVAFVYLLLSLVCSAVREGLEAWFKTRAVNLEQGIRELLQDRDGSGLTKDLYGHPRIMGLFKGNYEADKVNARGWFGRTNLPAYIPAGSFALALLDIAARGPVPAAAAAAPSPSPALSLDAIRAKVEAMETIRSLPLQRILLSAIDAAKGDLATVQANLEAWYDSAMDRVSGWYKRRTQLILLLLGLGGTIALNINTIRIATYLYQNRAARDALVAEAAAAQGDPTLRAAPRKVLVEKIEALALPIGWSDGLLGQAPDTAKSNWWDRLITVILGWLITAFAVTLGAPFWFDLVNKFMVIRSTVKPREKSQEEGSEDRQPARPKQNPSAPPPEQGGEAAGVQTMSDTVTMPGFQPQLWATGDPQEGVL